MKRKQSVKIDFCYPFMATEEISDENKIIEKQATINIGTIGHVAHGKTTVEQRISGMSTIRYKTELERNITIKLGYANAKIYERECARPEKYSSTQGTCSVCHKKKRLIRHVSFVDCPGHDILMATMLNGTAIMDAALLLVAANEACPQPQTTGHLFAVEIMNLSTVVVIQNTIDLVTKEQALEQYDQIKEFMKTSRIDGPIVPVSAQMNINVEAILDFIVNYIDIPKRDRKENPRMIVIRSFDINKPGTTVDNLCGGVIGGSLVSGMLAIGDEIEVRPGMVTSNKSGSFVCRPFVTKIAGLKAEKTDLEVAYPGGLIGVETDIDPSFCRADKLVGMVMGLKGKLPSVLVKIRMNFDLFQETVVSTKEDLKMDESILLNIGSTTTGCKIVELEGSNALFSLYKPCCCEKGERISISRKIKNNWRLIGHGVIESGEEAKIIYD